MLHRLLLVFTLLLLPVTPLAAQEAEPAAVTVYGQPDFASNAVGHNANGLSFPIGLALDSSGDLYIADRNNSRILYFTSGNTTADRVYGQFGNFTTNPPSSDGVGGNGIPSADRIGLFSLGVLADGDGGLYVSDS